MTLYRKRPVVVEAIQLTERTEIATLEGVMIGNPGDWLITGVKGEQYPCKADVFEVTYELATVAGQRQVTHWEDCWRAPDHHACAVAMVERLIARIAELNSRIEEYLFDAAVQCWLPAKQEYDSMAVTAYADALRELAELGKVTITHDVGRRVIAVPKVPQP